MNIMQTNTARAFTRARGFAIRTACFAGVVA